MFFALLTAIVAMAIQGVLGFMGVNPILNVSFANATDPAGAATTVAVLQGLNIAHMVTNGLVGLALGLVIARGTTSILQPWGNRLRGRRIRRFSRNGRVEQEPSRDPVGIGSG